MDSSMEIPQEIIGEIISHLSADIETLKSCATAARLLYPASRQHIFSTVHLYSLSKVQSLHQLLESSPEISSLVHTLHVLPFRSESLLPIVLPKLSKLQHLSIGRKGFGTSWRSIPVSAKNALKELIKSPTLCTLEFEDIFHLPVSVFSAANHVKTLNVYLVVLATSNTRYPDPDGTNNVELRAESIKFIDFVPGPNWVCPIMPYLRHCMFGGRAVQGLAPIQKTVTSGAGSIEDITWLEFEGGYIDLGIISHLQHLTFVTRTIDHDRLPSILFMWTSMSEILANTPLRDLQEFNVTVKIFDIPVLLSTSDDTYLGATRAWWNNFDALLGDPSKAPKLRVVNFILTPVLPHINNNTTCLPLINERLPLLRNRGILSTSLTGQM